jgi:hypothetical protein
VVSPAVAQYAALRVCCSWMRLFHNYSPGLLPQYSHVYFVNVSCAGTYFYPRGVRQESSQPNSAPEHNAEEMFIGADGRATSAASSAESQKFLNSGCILGTFCPVTGVFIVQHTECGTLSWLVEVSVVTVLLQLLLLLLVLIVVFSRTMLFCALFIIAMSLLLTPPHTRLFRSRGPAKAAAELR